MKVIDAIRRGNVISVEVEPPVLGKGISSLFDVLDPLVELEIGYIDITYHPQNIVGHGYENGRTFPLHQRLKPGTEGVAGRIVERYKNKGVFPVPHVICTGFTKQETEEYLATLSYLEIENVLAVRGDPPKDITVGDKRLPFTKKEGGHAHACELIREIADLKAGRYISAKGGLPIDFCIGAGCYPEKHPESDSVEMDVRWTKMKVDAGADYLVTQMFFDNDVYFRFVDTARADGIDVPIIPGIMPLFKGEHVTGLPRAYNVAIPSRLRQKLEKCSDKEDIRRTGIEWCVEQALSLRKNGVPSLHIYATRGAPAREVVEAVGAY